MRALIAMPQPCLRMALAAWLSAGAVQLPELAGGAEAEPKRTEWTTSRVVGTPDPPLPYTVEPYAAQIAWKRPIYAVAEPGTRFLLVIEQGGEADRPSRVLRWNEDNPASAADVLLEMADRLIYSVTFHPDYEKNGQFFVFSNGPTNQSERMNRVSRFVVSREPPHTCDMKSEQAILEWRSMGHDGGDLLFGNDGMLYISSGDGTSDSDVWVSAQDVSNLLGAVLRIDVDHPAPGQAYGIPNDNPFTAHSGARGEIWAFGLRNPWRMSVDRRSGQIWVGNNGQDLWETVHLVRRGDNYGWSVYEGNHPFYLHRQLGPAPFVPPTLEHHHREARSLTGGVTYRGSRLPQLDGVYCYGDYATGKIWGVRHDGQRVRWHEELADTALQIAGFAVSHHGELLVVDHGSGLYRLVKRPESAATPSFPQRLSETGIFRSVASHDVQPGIVPYSVCASAWMDGAMADRYLGLPGDKQLEYAGSGGWNAPDGTVVIQTLSLPVVRQDPSALQDASVDGKAVSMRRIETRLMVRQQGEWAGYSYRWNDGQDDAELVPAEGDVMALRVASGDGLLREQVWRFPSRAECMSCHSRAANYLLGLSTVQMNREHLYDDGPQNQLRRWQAWGLFASRLPESAHAKQTLVDPYDASEPVDRRARAYLHVNCSGCHVEAGGGNARIRLDLAADDNELNLFDVPPQHSTFDIVRAALVAKGEPERSVLLQRVARRGPGQMPPLGTNVVDTRGAALLRAWIEQMERSTTFVKQWTYDELRDGLEASVAGASAERGADLFAKAQCTQCHRVGDSGGGAGPNLTDVGRRLPVADILRSTVDPSDRVAPEFAATVIHTLDGRTLEGRIELESETTITLRLSGASAEPVELPVEQIEERTISARSTMPTGLLDHMQREEIYDLLAYLTEAKRPGDGTGVNKQSD